MKLDFDNKSEDVRIELIPLIDVIFCILIFFILAALQLTRQQAININLPQSETSALQNRETLIVSVDSIGQLYVDRTPVSEDQLYLLLEGYNQTNPQGLMLLNADRSAIYDDVVRVLDLMRSVGGDRVALATQPGQASPRDAVPALPGDTAPGGLDPNALPGLPGLDAPTDGLTPPPSFEEDITAPATGEDSPADDLRPPADVNVPGADAEIPAGELVPPGDVTAPGEGQEVEGDLIPPPSF